MSPENPEAATSSLDPEILPPEAPEPAEDSPLAKAQAEAAAFKDRALRTLAELENYRKRAQRELADERKYAVVPFARDLLPVVDNLERAIAAAQKSSDSSGLLDGVKLVECLGLVRHGSRAQLPLLDGRPAIVPQAHLGKGGDGSGQLHGRRERRTRLHHPIDETHLVGLGRVDPPASEDQVHGP